MEKRRAKRRGSAGDRAVAVGGFLIVVLTGFFGAEPDERQRLAERQEMSVQSNNLSGAMPAKAGMQ